MSVRQLSDLSAYNKWISERSHGSLWQSLAWKKYQEALGREVRIYIQEENGEIQASALVVIDRTSFGLSVWDMPKGPLWKEGQENNAQTLLDSLIKEAQKEKCMTLYYSTMGDLKPTQQKAIESGRHEQPEATRIINLEQSEEEILKQMKPKGRYNIKVAQKHGVTVQQSDDIDVYYALAADTAKRDGFSIPSKKQLQAFLEHLDGSFLLLASIPNPSPNPNPIAGLLGVIHNKKGVYYYGASNHAHRALMAPYLLQWHAMQHCKTQGCTAYDLLGVAPPGSPDNHPWSGITSFKEKFGGQLVSYPKERQIALKPFVQNLINFKRQFFG